MNDSLANVNDVSRKEISALFGRERPAESYSVLSLFFYNNVEI